MSKMNKNKDIATSELKCIDNENNWSISLDFDATEEELERFYEHAERCPYHKAIVEKSFSTLSKNLRALDIAFEIKEVENGDCDRCNYKMLCEMYNYEIPHTTFLMNCGNNYYEISEDFPSTPPSLKLFTHGRHAQLSRKDYINFLMTNPTYRVDCDFSLGLTDSRVLLLYFGLSSAAKASGVSILSECITDANELQARASFKVIANDEELEKISHDFQSRLGVTSVRVCEEQLMYSEEKWTELLFGRLTGELCDFTSFNKRPKH